MPEGSQRNETKPTGRISLGRWLGIDVTIDGSWFIIAFLLAWSFSFFYESTFPELERAWAILLGTAAAVLFFVSVLLHELSHSVMARRVGIPVEGITLFIFGGVTRTTEEAKSAGHEFAIAIVGPLASLGLAAVFWALVNLTGNALPVTVRYGLGHLGWLNLALGVFNMLPGYPLDGGRVLRSILWRATGDVDRATRAAVTGGKVVASVLVAIGLITVATGNLGGLWYAAIGWFLYQAAAASGQQVVVRRVFEGLVASDVMAPRLVTLSDSTTLQEAVDDYFLRYDHAAFPVNDRAGETIGLLTLRAARQVPRDAWNVRQVWSAMTRLEDACTVDADTPMEEVLRRLTESEDQRVLVVDGARVVGIITPRDVARWVQRTEELGLSDR
jgi:Zn-dependent protease/predicted transcriptional regulator